MENKILIDKAIAFIQKNAKNNLSLQSIADNAGFSLNYFDTIFKQHTGYSPVEYARVYKLIACAWELRRTEKTILDIALDFGYTSPESFARAFKGYHGMTPSEYREKYAQRAVTCRDFSGKIAIQHFKHSFPELKPADIDAALDYCFTHNPLKYAEDIVGMSIADVAVLTLGNTEALNHFLYVSEYTEPEAFVNIVCDNEADAVSYVKLLSKNPKVRFTIRKPIDCEWDVFDTQAAQLGLVCRYGYDMIYPDTEIDVPSYPPMVARELTIDDMPLVRAFQQKGGCDECHVRGLQVAFEKRGNLGERGFGVFMDNELVCLATPVQDKIRALNKYDVGALFTIEKGNTKEAVEYMWKYVIHSCIKDGAVFGNASAKEEDTPIGVSTSEKIGLVKVSKCCIYSK